MINMMNSTITTIDQKIADLFNNNFGLGGDWPWGNALLCFIAILLTTAFCFFVGAEREKRGRSAGLRTHLLVGIGSCIIMIISIYGFPSSSTWDVARLAAGVITGVGFLGAGTILHNNGNVRGLTTASTVWLVMAIGMACGSMNFFLALLATIVVIIVLVPMRKLEKKLMRSNPLVAVIVKDDLPITTAILTAAKNSSYYVSDVKSTMVNFEDEPCVEVTFKLLSENGAEVKTNVFIEELSKVISLKNVQVLDHH